MRYPFATAEIRWNDWNIDHCAKHGVPRGDVESVIRRPARQYPRRMGNKWVAVGRGSGARIKVIFIKDPTPWLQVYPIHASFL